MEHLFVTQDYGPDLGGMARRHVELCRRFAPDRVVVSTVSHPRAREFDPGEGYPIARVPFSHDRAKHLLSQLRWAASLVPRCRAGAELMHCGNLRPCGYAVRMAAAVTRTPYLLYVYGGDLLRELEKTARSEAKRRSARGILEGAAGIVTISRWTTATTERLLAQVGARRVPPIADIDLGTDPVQFAPSRDRGRLRARLGLGDAPVMLTVARLVPHKGQDVALSALAGLRREFPGLRYLLVGSGHDESRLRALARELGVEGAVVFAGPLSDEEVAEAYATASVYVGLSRVDDGINVEGFGISFLEAGASGVPSVAGDSGGVRSAVRDGETGFVVPPEDAAAAAAALRALLADDGHRAAMGRAARAAVESHYNWDRVARDTLAFAHRVLEEPATRVR